MTATAAKPFKKGYKFRFYPTPEQRQALVGLFGANRFLWNTLLAKTQSDYETYQALLAAEPDVLHERPSTDGYYFCKLIPHLKAEHPWMGEHSSVTYQQTALHLGGAYKRFFKNRLAGAGRPRFKSKRDRQSVSLMKTAFTLRDGVLKVGKIEGDLKVLWSRELPSPPSSCTLSMTPTGDFYVSFTCEYVPQKTSGTGVTGIDFGLKDLFVLSSGEKITNPRHYTRTQRKLKRLQQHLARKKKGSKNREKARLRVAKCHERIANQRLDHLHQHSRRLVNDNQVIGIESLNVKGMVKNRRLAKHIVTAGWAEFARQLAYKTRESGHCHLVMMHRFFPSSHLCASTGLHVGRKLSLAERSWTCPHCGEEHDRDVNAAQVIAVEAMHCIEQAGSLHSPHTGAILIGEAYRDPRGL